MVIMVNFVWGKSIADSAHSVTDWLPLWVHLHDSAHVSKQLFKSWLPARTRNMLQEDLDLTLEELEALVQFLAGVHDTGKCSPDFGGRKTVTFNTFELYQRMLDEGYKFDLESRTNIFGLASYPESKAFRHELLSDVFLVDFLTRHKGVLFEKNKQGVSSTRNSSKVQLALGSVLAGHHGSPAELTVRSAADLFHSKGSILGEDHDIWVKSLDDTYSYIFELVSSSNPSADLLGVLNKLVKGGLSWRSQIALTSIVILSDWVASNSDTFGLIPFDVVPELGDVSLLGDARYSRGISEYGFPVRIPVSDSLNSMEGFSVEKVFLARFGFDTPNVFQREAVNSCVDLTGPSLVILEAGMGSGKTEAGLIVAEIFERKGLASGFFFGLPTMATANAIFKRVSSYLSKKELVSSTVGLIHSKAHLDDNYQSFKEQVRSDRVEGLVPSGWLNGSKQRLLNDYVVGTVDAFLMLALKQKWAYFRHLGFMSKTIIIDEVHAMDDYMFTYLVRAVEWAGYYGCPVVALSATLPSYKSASLREAYSKGRRAALA